MDWEDYQGVKAQMSPKAIRYRADGCITRSIKILKLQYQSPYTASKKATA